MPQRWPRSCRRRLLLGKRVRNAAKDTPYESGMRPIGSARERFSVKFFLVAMVFILFDIEAIFLYPWAVVFRELARESRLFPFIEMLLFIVLVLIGFFYIWKKGVLDWSQEAMEEFRSEEAGKSKTFRPRIYAGRGQVSAVDRKVTLGQMISDQVREIPVVSALVAQFPDAIIAGTLRLNELTLEVDPARIVEVCRFLKEDQKFIAAQRHYRRRLVSR